MREKILEPKELKEKYVGSNVVMVTPFKETALSTKRV